MMSSQGCRKATSFCYALEFIRMMVPPTWEVALASADKIRLFSYGTLQLESVQLASFGRRLVGRRDAMRGFRKDLVEITDTEVIAKSGERFHPIVVGRSDDEVEGMVFEITAAELAAADAYEVSDYRRVEIVLRS